MLFSPKPMFVARDVALSLGYKRPADAVASHCKHPELLKGSNSEHLKIPNRCLTMIPEGDVYRLIVRSKLPATINGVEIRFDGELVNLTTLHKAAGGESRNRPHEWAKTETAKAFIAELATELQKRKSSLFNSRKGRYGGTFGHWQIALAYAKYLSPEFHIAANKIIKRYIEEEIDPSKAIDRAVNRYRRMGMSDAQIEARLKGTVTRNGLTATVARILDDQGDPWFVAKDVCDVLGMGTSNLSKVLDEDERDTYTVRTLGGDQQMAVINESGLYSLILRSRKPVAKKFKKWVTRDVLPSIRKHGMYATPETVEQMLADPDTMIQTLTSLCLNRVHPNETRSDRPGIQQRRVTMKSKSIC